MSEYLWKFSDLLHALNGRPVGQMPAGVTGISIDTRTLQPGEAFFAIRGDRFDGHDFATAALRAGAAVLVVAEQKLPAMGRVQAPLVVVEDVLQALGRLAVAARARSEAQIVAVTGSVGKTTTKELMRSALGACGKVHASSASFNNHWGVPLSLARMPADTRFGVFEIGMNHPGEIRPLVKLVRPHVAIVTLIAAAHLGYFRDLDGIAEAKAEIFEGVVPGGTAILNGDDARCGRLAEHARAAGVQIVKTFGEASGADFRLLDYRPEDHGARLSARIGGEAVELRLQTPGRHVAQNALAVLGTGHVFGTDIEAFAAALGTWRTGKGRGERHELSLPAGGKLTLVDDSYNANPASIGAAIRSLAAARPGEGGRRIAVLGDMRELGEHSAALHGELSEPIREAKIDKVLLAGEEMKALDQALSGQVDCTWHETVGALQADLIRHVRAGDVVLVKASNGLGFSRIVETMIETYPPVAAKDGPAAAAPSRMNAAREG